MLSRVRHLIDGLARLMNTIYPGFVFRDLHLLLGRLPSKADEFYLPKATGLKAPDIRRSPVVCLQKQSLPRVGHQTCLSGSYMLRVPHGTFHGSARAYLRSSPRHDRPFKDQQPGAPVVKTISQLHPNCHVLFFGQNYRYVSYYYPILSHQGVNAISTLCLHVLYVPCSYINM